MSEENTPVEEISEEDIAAFAASLEDHTPETLEFTLLESWKNLLANLEGSRDERINPQIASRLVQSWPKLDYSDLTTYWELYHDFLGEMRGHLEDVIAEKPDCLTLIEDDAEENRDLYLELAFLWSDTPNRWEEEWDVTSPRAGIELAAMVDAASFFIGQTGILAHLNDPRLGFDFGNEEQDALQTRLMEAVAERKQ